MLGEVVDRLFQRFNPEVSHLRVHYTPDHDPPYTPFHDGYQIKEMAPRKQVGDPDLPNWSYRSTCSLPYSLCRSYAAVHAYQYRVSCESALSAEVDEYVFG